MSDNHAPVGEQVAPYLLPTIYGIAAQVSLDRADAQGNAEFEAFRNHLAQLQEKLEERLKASRREAREQAQERLAIEAEWELVVELAKVMLGLRLQSRYDPDGSNMRPVLGDFETHQQLRAHLLQVLAKHRFANGSLRSSRLAEADLRAQRIVEAT